jgi:NADH-quinone oxidoreductase subunit E
MSVTSVAAVSEHRPAALPGPRGGTADDLKLIEGIGPKLEEVCNSLGFYHFDQIATWTAEEIAWVDANLTGFKGRVTRDRWVAQAKLILSVGPEEFLRRAQTNDY